MVVIDWIGYGLASVAVACTVEFIARIARKRRRNEQMERIARYYDPAHRWLYSDNDDRIEIVRHRK